MLLPYGATRIGRFEQAMQMDGTEEKEGEWQEVTVATSF
jgi:hypothetical protein